MPLILDQALKLPIGKPLAHGNWESFVYELGEEYVYKEIKPTDSLENNVANYPMRAILQDFWNTDIHFQHMQNDATILASEIAKWLPDSVIKRGNSLLSARINATYTIQERIYGREPEHHPDIYILAKRLLTVCENTFHAPVDLHFGNLIVTGFGDLYFIDTGTPSDWAYFLDPNKMRDVLGLSAFQADEFVRFMTPLHEKHWNKLKRLAQ